ncbi:hypothetical protein JCM3770_002185 [Rhodotorula araucariae]
MSAIHFKVSHGATRETRLVSFAVHPAPTWANLASQIQQRFVLEGPPSKVIYTDGDGGEITLSTSEELAEVWSAITTDTTLVFTFQPQVPGDEHKTQPNRSSEQVVLLKSVRQAVEKDASFVHDLREVVHDVLHASRHSGHFGDPRRPHARLGTRRGGGGHGGPRSGGRHHHNHGGEKHPHSCGVENSSHGTTGSPFDGEKRTDEELREFHCSRAYRHTGKGFKRTVPPSPSF